MNVSQDISLSNKEHVKNESLIAGGRGLGFWRVFFVCFGVWGFFAFKVKYHKVVKVHIGRIKRQKLSTTSQN